MKNGRQEGKALSDVVMPNGKRLGDCTFREIKALGKRMERIAKAGGGNGFLPGGLMAGKISKVDYDFAMQMLSIKP